MEYKSQKPDLSETSGGAPEFSVVVPVFNEKENLSVLFEKIRSAAEGTGKKYEVIFIDDGSSDGSGEVLKEISNKDSRVRVIHFRKNYGQTSALQAGFDYASGEIVVTLDADLQNDPSDIPQLLKKIEEGYDVISGWRRDRKDKMLLRKVPSWIANRLINRLISSTGCRLHDFGCTLKAYRSWVVKSLNIYGEMHRFLPVFAALEGAKIGEIVVQHYPRKHGKSKYTLGRVFKVTVDLVTIRFFATSLTRPSHFFGKVAGIMFCAGLFAIAFLSAVTKLSHLRIDFNSYLIIVTLTIYLAVQFLVLGLLGEIMIRSYFESRKKRSYAIKNIDNMLAGR